MRWSFLLLFLIPISAHAFVNLSTSCSEDGGYKLARQDNCSSIGTSRAWDGTTIKLFGGKGELLTWVTYLIGGGSDAANVNVSISSFTGTGTALGSGFSAVVVSSTNVWDYTQRPYSLYKYSYLQEIGMNSSGPWDPSEYEERQLPVRWRRPCTVNANSDCVPNGGTLFTDRADHNKFYPDPAVPIEEFSISSFTVSASSSQAIGGEVYISTSLPSGTYTSTLTVTEGITVSTTIPIILLVYNVQLPATATIPVIADVGVADLDMRLTGTRHPANEFVDPYLTHHLRVAAFLHRHKIIEIGDPNTAGQDFPSIEYKKHIDGSAFKETYGLAYNTGPGYGAGDPFYMIGTYGSWATASWSTSTVGGANGYCTNVSSWTAYCQTNGLNCQLYTRNDEASTPILAGEVNTESIWSSTAPSCANAGHVLPYWQTARLPTLIANAPNVTTAVSTSWLAYSSATWVADESLYQQSSTHAAWGYNSGIGVDSVLADQEAGLGSREPMWGMYKTGQEGWFLWEINYWNDSNNGGQAANGFNANASNDNDTFNISKTFGYDNFPTVDTIKGHLGFNFANGDGVMLYPATDSVYANPSFGFNGVIGSWKLNMLTRGIQDVDIIKLAFAKNPATTTTLVNSVVQDVMYLRQCFTLADCTYVYGDRPWSESRDLYETTRESLLQIAAGTFPVTPASESWSGAIVINGKGTLQ